MYRGAEPIKGFAVYAVPANSSITLKNARLIELIVADKYIDVNPPDYTIKNADRIMVAAVDRNNNISDWIQLK
jgi:hypothetical protein